MTGRAAHVLIQPLEEKGFTNGLGHRLEPPTPYFERKVGIGQRVDKSGHAKKSFSAFRIQLWYCHGRQDLDLGGQLTQGFTLPLATVLQLPSGLLGAEGFRKALFEFFR